MKKIKKISRIIWNNRKVIGYMLLFLTVWLLIMWLIDLCLPCVSKLPHRISGEIWFQLISSAILTIPTTIISAYALLQTEKYRKLDEERYRPELLMQLAELSMCMINWNELNISGIDEKQKCEQYRERLRRDYGEQKVNYSNVGLLNLQANFVLKSGDSVDWIRLTKIEFKIQQKSYGLEFGRYDIKVEKGERRNSNCKFEWNYEDGCETYHLEWQLDFSAIHLNDCEWEEFWDDMYEAVVADEADICKRAISANAEMQLGFGSGLNKDEGVLANWGIRWDGTEKFSTGKCAGRVKSNSGIFKYNR